MKLRVFCFLTLLCVILTCVSGLSSCTVEEIAPLLEDYISTTEPESEFFTTVEIEETDESDSNEPVTLPGEATVAPDCSHRYGEWKVAQDAECETEGLQYRLCEKCNGREESAISPTGHTEEDMKPIPATCVLAGREGGTQCAVCKKVLTAPTVLLAKGHPSYSNGHCTACLEPVDGSDGLVYLDVYNQSYGYEYLGTMESGDALQTLYRAFDEAVKLFHTDPSVEATELSGSYVVCSPDFAKLGLTKEEAQAVWKTYRDDHPLYYWISNQVGTGDDKIYLMVFSDYADGETRMETNQLVYDGIAEYLSEVYEGSTDYEVALLIHDALIRNIDYAYNAEGVAEEADWAHSILGIFDGRGAVCEGIAKAYQLLLCFYDVDCLFVTGESRGVGHAWNVICLDGAWYGVDVTWDENYTESEFYDAAQGIPYNFFCLSATEFAKDRKTDSFEAASVAFLYKIPTLSEYGIEWVDLYMDTELIGRYSCIDLAFEAMDDVNGCYLVRLCDGSDGSLIHVSQEYHIVGAFPIVDTLTLVGKHKLGIQTFTATQVYLTSDVILQSDFILKSIFLMSETPVKIKCGSYQIRFGNTTEYYSALKENVYLS